MSNWDISKVSNKDSMFYDATSLTTITISAYSAAKLSSVLPSTVKNILEPSPVMIARNLKVRGNITATGTITQNSSQTITHKTNLIGELGTFCESTGKIYNGYNTIANTDCICQVQQSKSLNKKIIGIITANDEFASHGDVLVKIAPGEYEIGDILCPDENGYGRKATESDLMFMMLHAIPRPKITSLESPYEGCVACFLI
jgi:hypothetical protein